MAVDADFISDLTSDDGGNPAPAPDTVVAHVPTPKGTVPAHGIDAVPAGSVAPKVRTEQQAAADDKPLTLRDQISNALKGDENTPPAASQDGRVRNPDGTYAAKIVEGAPVVVDPAAAPAVAAPHGIDPEVFKSLPAETQANLARTMDGIAAQQTRFAALEPLEQVIVPRIQAWALNGMQPAQAVHQLLALSDFATRDPTGFVKYFAQREKIDLEQLVLDMVPEQVDPNTKALLERIAALEGHRNQMTQQEQQAAHTSRKNDVIAFAQEKSQDGKALRPYFEEVANDVMPFITLVKSQNPSMSNAQVLQEAYDRACWGNPSVRAKMQTAVNANAEAERLRQGADKTDRARAASASVKNGAPTSNGIAPNDPAKSVRDQIRAAMAAHSS